MRLTNGTVPVYTVAGSSINRNLPDWLSQRQKRKKDPEYANRVELLQDFEFEEASQCVRISEDGEWVMSTGTYKPQIHTHYLPNLALSWARHTNTLNKTFIFLSSDYSKTAHLQEDRSLEFHTPGGCHESLRIPRYGRDLAYDRSNTELLVPAVGVNKNGMGEVFRFNLELGRFMSEFEIDVGGDDLNTIGGGALQGGIQVGSVNVAAVAEGSHNLLAFGTSLGTVEYWDTRSRAPVATLAVPSDFEGRPEVTALDYHRSGISMAVGTSSGLIYLYDLRSSLPTLKKDHGYGYPVQYVQYLAQGVKTRDSVTEPKIASADRRILKLWDESDGTPWTSVEPAVDINCVAWCRDSGMFLTANEGRQQHAFFIPQLGPAPKWCSFLDNVVEEMADDPNDPYAFTKTKVGEIYDNYKFLTPPQLRMLNLDHLIGKTNLLRPYMHGFFVAQGLYEEARLIANPTSWEEERAKRIQAKIDKERESRIRGKKKITAKVNRKFLERILEREEKNERRRAQRVLAQGGDDVAPTEATGTVAAQGEDKGLFPDARFARMFQEEDFAVDETSREFQQLNPTSKAPASNLDREKGLTAVEEEAIDEVPGSSDEEDKDEDDFYGSRNKSGTRISTADYKRRPNKKQKKRDQIQMRVKSSGAGSAARTTHDRSFGSRAENLQPVERKQRRAGFGGAVGDKVITFEPTKKSKGLDQLHGGSHRTSRGQDRRSASGNTFRKM
ncbi:Ribosome biogenesis protein ENP2 [Cladophialophora carrionii]|uniref:Ribosome biogenesis protein ENP2 n=1 Tax=Cladophialophora carrionii TaxID=86049 RepID=A0A1C1CCN1_9EURO|nr:Ribosome biogenesis protein ENP2 [Cladophialophora carrionii]